MCFSKVTFFLCVFITLLFALFSSSSLSAVINCRPEMGDSINIDVSFDISSNSSSIEIGKELASASSDWYSMRCNFTAGTAAVNTVYFKNMMPNAIKSMLTNSGVKITQRQRLGNTGTVTITDSTVPNLYVFNRTEGAGTNVGFGFGYQFTAIKGPNALKPFDTGVFLLGTHINGQGTELGVPVYLRVLGKLTLLCPAPAVNITASNGGSVNFDTISPKQMNAGDVVSRTFNLGMSVPQDCETGLNISVRFEPNNNTVLGGKYLDMGNGLQTLLTRNSTDINYNESYSIGEIMPQSPISVPFTATLSKIAGSTIASGPFSKTVRVVVSY